MPFNDNIRTRIRKDPLGYAGWNEILRNHYRNQAQYLVEHAPDGKHNAMEVARGVSSVMYSAGYTLSGKSSTVSSVSSSATGVVTVTLASGYFDPSTMVVQATAIGNESEAKPVMIQYEVVSSTSLKFYISKLDSALGAGNSWVAVDDDFCFKVHSKKFQPTTGSTLAVPSLPYRGIGARAGGAYYISATKQQGELRYALSVGHDTSGNHNCREVARDWFWISEDGGGYNYSGSSGISGVNRTSAGIIQVQFSTSYASPLQVFAQPDYQSRNGGAADDLFVVCFPHSQTSFSGGSRYATAYCYQFDFGAATWALADCDFRGVFHQAAF